jgi:hypothetical protein
MPERKIDSLKKEECIYRKIPTNYPWGKKKSVERVVSLPRGHFQGIQRMMMLTTHGLFLTCTQKFYLYIYITQIQYYIIYADDINNFGLLGPEQE